MANLELANSTIGVSAYGNAEAGIVDILNNLKSDNEIEAYGPTGNKTITGITFGTAENGIELEIDAEVEKQATFTSSDPSQDYYVQIRGKKYPIAKTNGVIKITKTEITPGTNPTGEITDVLSSNESYATVEKVSGTTDKIKITGVAKGTATITAKYTNEIYATIPVTVKGNVAITLQSSNNSYGTVETTVNGTYLEGTQITLSDELVTPGSEYKFDGWYINNEKITLETGNKYTVPTDGTTNITIIANFVEKPKTISESTSGVGYYIKKGDEYAIVFADRVAQASTDQKTNTVTWSRTNTSSCTFPKLTGNENFKTYVISDEEYTDPRTANNSSKGFGTHKVIKVANDNAGTEDRFMAMALSDVDMKYHCWYYSALSDSRHAVVTETGFNTGKTNTQTMITKWNNTDFGSKNGDSSHPDVWGIVQTKFNQGWFVPSKDEWSAFAAYLKDNKGLTTSNYSSTFGLSNDYWSSSQSSATRAWHAYFDDGFCNSGYNVTDNSYVRLATTF